jgi:hypothetical protein
VGIDLLACATPNGYAFVQGSRWQALMYVAVFRGVFVLWLPICYPSCIHSRAASEPTRVRLPQAARALWSYGALILVSHES